MGMYSSLFLHHSRRLWILLFVSFLFLNPVEKHETLVFDPFSRRLILQELLLSLDLLIFLYDLNTVSDIFFNSSLEFYRTFENSIIVKEKRVAKCIVVLGESLMHHVVEKH